METNRGNKQYQEKEQQQQPKWQDRPGKDQEQSIERGDVSLDRDEDLQTERKPSKDRLDENEQSERSL